MIFGVEWCSIENIGKWYKMTLKTNAYSHLFVVITKY